MPLKDVVKFLTLAPSVYFAVVAPSVSAQPLNVYPGFLMFKEDEVVRFLAISYT